jgi:hypothetical protein
MLLGIALAVPCITARAAAESGSQRPRSSLDYFQYGVAVTGEVQAYGGDVCPAGSVTPCILGGGGGLTLRGAHRGAGPWYAGGAYEFSRHDSSNLLRLAILQQLRGEVRYYLDRGTRLTPYGAAGAGLVAFGPEWAMDTGGVVVTAGGGGEFQISQSTVVGCAAMYRAFLLRGFTDTAGQQRADQHFGFGLAHFIGLELVFEVRDPLPRW